jgi:hypothetical protein
MTSAWSMDGSAGRHLELGEQPEPMPTITASTSTLMPEDTTLPSTFSARNAVLFQSANGHQHEARERGQLELDQRDEELHRQHEEADDHHQPGEEHHHDGVDVHEHLGEARHVADLLQIGAPASMPTFASRPGCKKFSIVMAEPVAVRPKPANERNTMLASQLKLPMM